MTIPLSVVVLTHDEELNIQACLDSIYGWIDEIFICDSFSTDGTVELCRRYTDKIVQHAFEGFANQRNWALRNLPYAHDWVLFLDADEMVSAELRTELTEVLPAVPREVEGFYVKRRLIFMGRWIRWGGYYPTWLLRVMKHTAARCADRSVNEHFLVEGPTRSLQSDLIHCDQRGISHWIAKHNQYASHEATELRRADHEQGTRTSIRPRRSWLTNPPERTEWMRRVVWRRMPPLWRPFLYFGYRFILRLGFLDGKQGLIYHFLQGLWLQFLIDVKYLELKQEAASKGAVASTTVTSKMPRQASSASTQKVRD